MADKIALIEEIKWLRGKLKQKEELIKHLARNLLKTKRGLLSACFEKPIDECPMSFHGVTPHRGCPLECAMGIVDKIDTLECWMSYYLHSNDNNVLETQGVSKF